MHREAADGSVVVAATEISARAPSARQAPATAVGEDESLSSGFELLTGDHFGEQFVQGATLVLAMDPEFAGEGFEVGGQLGLALQIMQDGFFGDHCEFLSFEFRVLSCGTMQAADFADER
jgi:hypothetical protein